MNILAVDASTNILSIALKRGGYVLSYSASGELKHGERLVPLLDALFREAGITPRDLNLLVYAKGPGSFTGLRIGLSTLKGLSFADNIPMAGVPSLDMWAYGLDWFPGMVLPVLDARKNSFYTAIFKGGRLESAYLDASASEITTLTGNEEKLLLTGPGAPFLAEKLTRPQLMVDPRFDEGRATHLATLGKRLFAEKGPEGVDEGPLYVRKSDAELNEILKKRIRDL